MRLRPSDAFSASVWLLVGLSAGCGRTAPPAAEERIPVEVRRPRAVDRPLTVRASGTIEPRETAKTGFQVPGRIRRIYVEEGFAVRAGQLLAELDPEDYKSAEAIAAAGRDAAGALAEKARAGARAQELAQAKAALDLAEDEHRRARILYERQSLPAGEFKKAETQLEIARQRYGEAREGARREDVAAAEAQARQAEANLGLNSKRLADTRLLAPISGYVIRRLAEAGEIVSAGMPVLVLAQIGEVRVRAGVAENDIARVRAGQPAQVTAAAVDGSTFAGRVELLAYAAEPETRTYPVRILVPNPKLLLRAGMTAEAEIETADRVRALTLPGETIVRDPQGATVVYVYAKDKGRVYGRRVQTGAPLGGEVIVTAGRAPEDWIVVAGQHRVREGSVVEIVQPGREASR